MTLSIANFNPDPDAPAALDFIHPAEYAAGQREALTMSSNWANRLLENELDPRSLRPYRLADSRGIDRTYIDRIKRDRLGNQIFKPTKMQVSEYGRDGSLIQNERIQHIPQVERVLTNDTNATLRFLDWIQLDEAIIRAAKPRLRAAKDLREAGLVYQLPNGIAKTVMQYQQQSTIGGAVTSMDGLRQSESDRPVFSLLNFPLPIIHKDFQYPLRQVLASRTGYSPLDTTTAEEAGRRVAEQVEQYTLGCGANSAFGTAGQLLGQSSFTWNSSTIQGYMNYTNRITYSIVQPTAAGWIPQNTLDDVLAMKTASQNAQHFGPWMLYFGIGWDRYMDDEFKPGAASDITLRQRLREIDGIIDARTVDYIPDMSLILVQQTTDVVRLVIGLDITTVQWESHGGMQLNFKVMCVILPQLRTDFYGLTGIVHGS